MDNVRLDEEMGAVELGGGEVIVRVPFADLWRAYTKLRSKLGADSYESPAETMEGFWDWTKKVSRIVKEVVKSPVVKMVAGNIPVVGGTIRTVLDAADQTIRSLDAITKKQPPKVAALVKDVAAAKPAAVAAVKRLPPASQAKIKKLALFRKAALKTVKDATELKKVAHAAGYTPALMRALGMPRAPWRR